MRPRLVHSAARPTCVLQTSDRLLTASPTQVASPTQHGSLHHRSCGWPCPRRQEHGCVPRPSAPRRRGLHLESNHPARMRETVGRGSEGRLRQPPKQAGVAASTQPGNEVAATLVVSRTSRPSRRPPRPCYRLQVSRPSSATGSPVSSDLPVLSGPRSRLREDRIRLEPPSAGLTPSATIVHVICFDHLLLTPSSPLPLTCSVWHSLVQPGRCGDLRR